MLRPSISFWAWITFFWAFCTASCLVSDGIADAGGIDILALLVVLLPFLITGVDTKTET